MESLRLPPADRVSEVFTGASSEHDRIHRLVETFFGAYERGAAGIAVARRERRHVAAVDESMTELENTLDALVVEALRPERPDSSSVTSLRALTDLEVWRALRDQGAAPAAAVDQASAAVERWLDGRPPR
jgi:hypothetical protein